MSESKALLKFCTVKAFLSGRPAVGPYRLAGTARPTIR